MGGYPRSESMHGHIVFLLWHVGFGMLLCELCICAICPFPMLLFLKVLLTFQAEQHRASQKWRPHQSLEPSLLLLPPQLAVGASKCEGDAVQSICSLI